MKTLKRMCLCLGLIALWLSSSAQPHIEIKGADTCAADIPIKNLRQANYKFTQLSQCEELNIGYNQRDIEYMLQVNSLQSSVDDYKKANEFSQKIIDDQASTIALKDQEITSHKRKIKWLKVQRIILTGAVLVLTGKIFL